MKRQLLLFILLFSGFHHTWSQCSTGSPVYNSIIADGNISDWNSIITNPDNITHDGAPDLDAPISDAGRDFIQMAYTSDASNLYLLFERAGSVNNQVTVMLFMDVNNNNGMQLNEPVIVLTWNGSNRRGNVDIYDYLPASPSGDPLTSDGNDMNGHVGAAARQNISTNVMMGTLDGLYAEIAVPFASLKVKGSINPLLSLSQGKNFNWHVSSLNGSISTFGNPNSTNDNWRRCDGPFVPMPVVLHSFEGMAQGGKIILNWEVDQNEDGRYFEIQKSYDGSLFDVVNRVLSTSVAGNEQYRFSETSPGIKVFYRLKITHSNNTFTYSKIIAIQDDPLNSAAVTMQNPFHNQLNITYPSGQEDRGSIYLYNMWGSEIYKQDIYFRRGPNHITIRLPGGIPGICQLKIITESGRVTCTKVMRL